MNSSDPTNTPSSLTGGDTRNRADIIQKRQFKDNQTYFVTFIKGHRKIYNDGNNLLCGLIAIQDSIVSQTKLLVPTLDFLKQIATTGELGQNAAEDFAALDNPESATEDFSADQLAAIVRKTTEASGTLMDLCLFIDDQRPQVFFPTSENTPVLFIHYNGFNHYEGMAKIVTEQERLEAEHVELERLKKKARREQVDLEEMTTQVGEFGRETWDSGEGSGSESLNRDSEESGESSDSGGLKVDPVDVDELSE